MGQRPEPKGGLPCRTAISTPSLWRFEWSWEALILTLGVFRAGLAAFTKPFADRYAADNIRMNNVLPGFIDSPPEKEEFRARIPLGRNGKSLQEIASAVGFLASEGGAYITCQNLRVDGGITRPVRWLACYWD